MRLMSDTQAAALRECEFSYEDVGGTLTREIPAGYHGFTRTRRLGVPFAEAADRLMSWRVHERAGVRVEASSQRVRPDDVVLMRLGAGRVSIIAPCRVLHVIESPDTVGFAYGTLPGHPESGEELFMLERGLKCTTFTIRAFSRPGNSLTRFAGSFGRGLQHLMTSRYLIAADET
jgi:uncharacterized protein (UPF0548 family)